MVENFLIGVVFAVQGYVMLWQMMKYDELKAKYDTLDAVHTGDIFRLKMMKWDQWCIEQHEDKWEI